MSIQLPKPLLLTLGEALQMLTDLGANADEAKGALIRACGDGCISAQARCRSYFENDGLHGGGYNTQLHAFRDIPAGSDVDWEKSSFRAKRNRGGFHVFTDVKLRRDDLERWISPAIAPVPRTGARGGEDVAPAETMKDYWSLAETLAWVLWRDLSRVGRAGNAWAAAILMEARRAAADEAEMLDPSQALAEIRAWVRKEPFCYGYDDKARSRAAGPLPDAFRTDRRLDFDLEGDGHAVVDPVGGVVWWHIYFKPDEVMSRWPAIEDGQAIVESSESVEGAAVAVPEANGDYCSELLTHIEAAPSKSPDDEIGRRIQEVIAAALELGQKRPDMSKNTTYLAMHLCKRNGGKVAGYGEEAVRKIITGRYGKQMERGICGITSSDTSGVGKNTK